MGELIDITGKRFGSWTVIERAENDRAGKAKWLCRCICGTEKAIEGQRLRSGSARRCKSCSNRGNRHGETHGESGAKLYSVWKNMRHRCSLKNNSAYKNYGGRGIRVCAEWDENFEAFRDWALANGHKENLEIDRIDNDGNYEPGNCRWATRRTQCRNHRRNVQITIKGKTRCLTEWAKLYNLNAVTVNSRYRKGTRGAALLKPARRRRTSND